MENEELASILEIVHKAERVGILLGSESEDADVLAAHALKNRLGEKAHIMNMPTSIQKRWNSLFPEKGIKKETSLSFDIEKNPIGELRYEKQDGHLRIFLSPERALTKDSFDLEEQYPACDVIITFGFANEDDLAETLSNDAPFKNGNHILDLSYTHMQNMHDSPQPTIIDNNNKKVILPWNEDYMKLWGRALLRSHTDNDTGVFWAFLPKEDFEKTNTRPSDLLTLVDRMDTTMTLPLIVLMLWQEEALNEKNEIIKAFVYSSNFETLQTISLEANTPIKNGRLILEPYTTFSEAEIEIRKIIKRAL